MINLNPFAILLALGSIVLSSSAQLLMKVGMASVRAEGGLDGPPIAGLARSMASPYVAGGLVAYGLSAALWLGVLARVPLSLAYPLVSLGIAMVVMSAWLLLGEPLPPMRVLGVGLIVLGVALVGLRG